MDNGGNEGRYTYTYRPITNTKLEYPKSHKT